MTSFKKFDFDIQHRPGEKMKHINALTRAPVEEVSETMDEVISDRREVLLTLSLEDQVVIMQSAD